MKPTVFILFFGCILWQLHEACKKVLHGKPTESSIKNSKFLEKVNESSIENLRKFHKEVIQNLKRIQYQLYTPQPILEWMA